MLPTMIPLQTGSQQTWFALCEGHTPVAKTRLGVVFLHSLGENRTGLNYLFSELSKTLVKHGVTTIRFDLAGLGESQLSLSVQLWRNQFDVVTAHLQELCEQVVVICRGSGKLAIRPDSQYQVILLNPCKAEVFHSFVDSVVAQQKNGLIEPSTDIARKVEPFWTNLGVEVESIGGLSLPLSFIDELKKTINPQFKMPSQTIYPTSDQTVFADTPNSICIGDDSLFRFEEERLALANFLVRRLVGNER